MSQLDLEGFVAVDYPRVVAAVRLVTGSTQDSADAVQDVLVGLIASPPSREIRNLAGWITVVACRRVRDIQRSRGAEARAIQRATASWDVATEIAEPIDVDVTAALAGLPDRQRQVCVMHYLLDQSVNDIAEGIGVSPGTVKTQLSRARAALAARLRREDHHG